MNLDLAISNTLKRSPMDSAMHGVASNLGDGHYRLNAFYESEEEAKAIILRVVHCHEHGAVVMNDQSRRDDVGQLIYPSLLFLNFLVEVS